MKRCPRCGTEKPLTEFTKDSTRKDGAQPYCRTCKSIQAAEWYRRRTPEEIRASNHASYLRRKAQQS